jgi:hypothetical protein
MQQHKLEMEPMEIPTLHLETVAEHTSPRPMRTHGGKRIGSGTGNGWQDAKPDFHLTTTGTSQLHWH